MSLKRLLFIHLPWHTVYSNWEMNQIKIRSAISISAVKPHPRALLARLPAVTGFYCRNCYSADLLVWMATYWNTFFNLELLLCALKKAARTRVRLGKSHDKTNLKMLICKTKFGVASWLWAITQQGRERTQSPPKRKRMAQKRPVRWGLVPELSIPRRARRIQKTRSERRRRRINTGGKQRLRRRRQPLPG